MDRVNPRASDSSSKGIKPHKKYFSMSQKKVSNNSSRRLVIQRILFVLIGDAMKVLHNRKIEIRLAFTSNDLTTGIQQTMSRLCSTTISYHSIVNYSLHLLNIRIQNRFSFTCCISLLQKWWTKSHDCSIFLSSMELKVRNHQTSKMSLENEQRNINISLMFLRLLTQEWPITMQTHRLLPNFLRLQTGSSKVWPMTQCPRYLIPWSDSIGCLNGGGR